MVHDEFGCVDEGDVATRLPKLTCPKAKRGVAKWPTAEVTKAEGNALAAACPPHEMCTLEAREPIAPTFDERPCERVRQRE